MKQINKIPIKIMILTLFSGKLYFAGLFSLLLSSFILIGFIPNTDFYNHKYHNNSINNSKGILLSINETNCHINDEPAIQYIYEYYNGNDTLNGESFGFKTSLTIGSIVDVEYLKDDISISRIRGTRNGAFDISSIRFLLFIALIGCIIILFQLYKRIKFIKVLNKGFDILPTKLKSEFTIPTISTGKSRPFYLLKFEYVISSYTLSKFIFTSQDDISMMCIRVSQILVDSRNYSNSYIIETLPPRVKEYILHSI